MDQSHGGIGLGGDDAATVVGNAGGGGAPNRVEAGEAEGLVIRSAHPVEKFRFALVVVFEEGIDEDQAALALGRFPKGRLLPQGFRTGIQGLLGQLGGLFPVPYPRWHQTPSEEPGFQGLILGKNQESGMRKAADPTQGRFILEQLLQFLFQSRNQGRVIGPVSGIIQPGFGQGTNGITHVA